MNAITAISLPGTSTIGEFFTFNKNPVEPRRNISNYAEEGMKTASSVFGVYEPNWISEVTAKLYELTSLPQNWDSYGGKPTSNEVAQFTLQLLHRILKADTPPPQILPLGSGGAQLEWHRNQIDLEIIIEAPNRLFFSFENHATKEEIERPLTADFTEIVKAIGKIN